MAMNPTPEHAALVALVEKLPEWAAQAWDRRDYATSNDMHDHRRKLEAALAAPQPADGIDVEALAQECEAAATRLNAGLTAQDSWKRLPPEGSGHALDVLKRAATALRRQEKP